METIEISQNLRKFKSEVITSKKGTKCLIIPLDENNLSEDAKGAIWARFTGWPLKEVKEENGFKQTHLVKQKFEKSVFEKFSEDQKKAIPIFGNVSEWAGSSNSSEPIQSESITSQDVEDDLPF